MGSLYGLFCPKCYFSKYESDFLYRIVIVKVTPESSVPDSV